MLLGSRLPQLYMRDTLLIPHPRKACFDPSDHLKTRDLQVFAVDVVWMKSTSAKTRCRRNVAPNKRPTLSAVDFRCTNVELPATARTNTTAPPPEVRSRHLQHAIHQTLIDT